MKVSVNHKCTNMITFQNLTLIVTILGKIEEVNNQTLLKYKNIINIIHSKIIVIVWVMLAIAKDLIILKHKYQNLNNNHKIQQFNSNNKLIKNNTNNKMHLISLSKTNCQIDNNE